MADPERNTRMLLHEPPRLVIAFYDHLHPASCGTSDMAPRTALSQVPVWLVPGPDVTVGIWMRPEVFPADRGRRVAPNCGRRRGDRAGPKTTSACLVIAVIHRESAPDEALCLSFPRPRSGRSPDLLLFLTRPWPRAISRPQCKAAV
jgi:hypothetical protein